MKSRKEKRKRKIWPKIIGSLILALLLSAGGYTFMVYHSFKAAVETMHLPVERTIVVERPQPVKLEKRDPFSVLLLGVDEREGDKGRSDTIIVLAVNPETNSVKMLSIPRDTRTEIVGKGTEDKINHAYAFGGVPMSMATVEKFLDIPIDYYLQINMEGFKDIVDAVGGVSVHNTLDFTEGGFHFPVGEIQLNGEKALSFARMRHEDPRGDWGRQSRQRKIIQAIISEGTSLSSLTNFSSIFTALGANVKTNLTFDQIVDIQRNYRDAGKQIEQMEISEKGTLINRIYYGIVAPEEKLRIQNELKMQLGLNRNGG